MESDFKGARLGNANFKNAIVTGTNFDDAWLFEANFEGTVGLTIRQLSKAKTLYGATSLPPHIESELRQRHAELFHEPGGLDFEEI
uniref:Pentapeptide repeat-containing protein n=1 Tax=Candidatus Kentrum sp. FM TaxID=2126340 RepID=A0A450TAY1_9GAMM|nr:MAG: Pentapeptide repeat-containing protein [Candidatus Kentron sp. FM]VFJ64445.1 MAG: Pentapeptide repeat-containing protein [Candidatus Kentron sp. FM]VFK14930.1 MAG: Pentapeptide repeat-containing protein [Candidatus Kentron sp. FM]